MSFLLKPRWLILHLCAIALAILFINFGFWQIRRLHQRQAHNTLLEERLSQAPEPLAKLLLSYSTDSPANDNASIAFRPVTVTGAYDSSKEVLLRTADNYNDQPGYYLLTPLKLSESEALLVKRGWVPFELNVPPIAEANPPLGQVELEGVVLLPTVRPSGFLSSLTPRDPPGELEITAYTDTKRLESQLPYKLLPVILDLKQQSPAQTTPLPLPNEVPEFTNGPHLGYAIQWFSFALIGIVGYSLLLRGLVNTQSRGSSNRSS